MNPITFLSIARWLSPWVTLDGRRELKPSLPDYSQERIRENSLCPFTAVLLVSLQD